MTRLVLLLVALLGCATGAIVPLQHQALMSIYDGLDCESCARFAATADCPASAAAYLTCTGPDVHKL